MPYRLRISFNTANDLSILLDNLLLDSFKYELTSEETDKIAKIKTEIDKQISNAKKKCMSSFI